MGAHGLALLSMDIHGRRIAFTMRREEDEEEKKKERKKRGNDTGGEAVRHSRGRQLIIDWPNLIRINLLITGKWKAVHTDGRYISPLLSPEGHPVAN